MRRTLVFAAALLVGAITIAPVQATGQNNANTVTIAATPTLLTFGGATVLTGQVTGAGNAGVRVDLQQNPYPFAGFKPTGTTVDSDAAGNYRFTVKPSLLTRYRVVAKASPQVESPAVEVRVRPRISLNVNDATARRGQRVRLTGSVTPAHDGRSVSIQRRIGRGAYRTIAKVTLARSTVAGRSDFRKTLRVTRTATYRVRFAADGDHAAGTSRTRRVRVR